MTHGVDIRPINLLIERATGWRATCDCGWESSNRSRRDDAELDGRAHLVMVAKRDSPYRKD